MTVVPAGVSIEVGPGETVFAAARRAGFLWPTICGGLGTCRSCYVVVREGLEHASPISDLEEEGIRALGRPVDGHTRLACQLAVSGPLVVNRRGVRREGE